MRKSGGRARLKKRRRAYHPSEYSLFTYEQVQSAWCGLGCLHRVRGSLSMQVTNDLARGSDPISKDGCLNNHAFGLIGAPTCVPTDP